MDPRKKRQTIAPEDLPALEKQDWEAVESGSVEPMSTPENGDFRFDEPTGELSDEDDDNAYQNSDEALPDDGEERAIRRENEERRSNDGNTS
jgi:hypothetical protein